MKTALASLTILTIAAVAPAVALTVVPSPVPEPGTVALVGGGLAVAILYARKRRARK